MPTTKAQIAATNRYMSKNYDSLRIVVPKGRKSDIDEYANQCGMSVNGLVNSLLQRELGLSDEAWRAKTTEPQAVPRGYDATNGE